MMMPSIFGENLFDDFMNDFTDDFAFPAFADAGKELYGKHAKNLMKTDVKDTENGYEVDIDLPGFKKEEVKVSLENGYLTVSAEKETAKDQKEKNSERYICKERYTGACERSFYVGEDLAQEDIKAEFKHGVLKLFIPKKPTVEQNRYIPIEG